MHGNNLERLTFIHFLINVSMYFFTVTTKLIKNNTLICLLKHLAICCGVYSPTLHSNTQTPPHPRWEKRRERGGGESIGAIKYIGAKPEPADCSIPNKHI